MTRKKKTKSKAKSSHPQTKRVVIASSIVLGAGAVFVGAAMGVGELDRRAARAITPDDPEVALVWPTGPDGTVWLPYPERERLSQAVSRAVKGGRALSQAPLREAGVALAQSGWVEGSPSARWTSDGRIVIAAKWRVPAAAVRVGQREVIIDWDRTVLPIDYAIDESNLCFFANADAALPDVGRQWSGADLQDGLALLRMLLEADLLEHVAGFDLGSGAESGTIKIITKRGTSIVWGAGPGRERPGEVPASVKVERLRSLQNRTGLLDGGAPFVDIRGSDIMINRTRGSDG